MQVIRTHCKLDEPRINNDSTHCAIFGDNHNRGVRKFASVTPLEDSSIVHHLAEITPLYNIAFHGGHLAFDDDRPFPTPGVNTALNEGTGGEICIDLSDNRDSGISALSTLPPSNSTRGHSVNVGGAVRSPAAQLAPLNLAGK